MKKAPLMRDLPWCLAKSWAGTFSVAPARYVLEGRVYNDGGGEVGSCGVGRRQKLLS